MLMLAASQSMNMDLYSAIVDMSGLDMKETSAAGLYSLSNQQRAAG